MPNLPDPTLYETPDANLGSYTTLNNMYMLVAERALAYGLISEMPDNLPEDFNIPCEEYWNTIIHRILDLVPFIRTYSGTRWRVAWLNPDWEAEWEANKEEMGYGGALNYSIPLTRERLRDKINNKYFMIRQTTSYDISANNWTDGHDTMYGELSSDSQGWDDPYLVDANSSNQVYERTIIGPWLWVDLIKILSYLNTIVVTADYDSYSDYKRFQNRYDSNVRERGGAIFDWQDTCPEAITFANNFWETDSIIIDNWSSTSPDGFGILVMPMARQPVWNEAGTEIIGYEYRFANRYIQQSSFKLINALSGKPADLGYIHRRYITFEDSTFDPTILHTEEVSVDSAHITTFTTSSYDWTMDYFDINPTTSSPLDRYPGNPCTDTWPASGWADDDRTTIYTYVRDTVWFTFTWDWDYKGYPCVSALSGGATW